MPDSKIGDRVINSDKNKSKLAFLFVEEDNGHEYISQKLNEEIVEWKMLIVDNEEDVHAISKLAIANKRFDGKEVQLLHAHSDKEARKILKENQDIVLVLLNVVLESNISGLDLVKYIRQDLINKKVRIILQTGQPEDAPEVEVIVDYDITDYKIKTELTINNLYTMFHASLKTYKALEQIGDYNNNVEQLVLQRTKELENKEEQVQTIADYSHDWVYWIDQNKKYKYISPSCERISGYRADHFLNDYDLLNRIVHPDDLAKVVKYIDPDGEINEIFDIDFRIIHHNGKELWINHISKPIYSKQGIYLGRRSSNRDITGQKHAEEMLKMKNDKLDNYTCIVGHDLKEPLRTVERFSLFLLDDYENILDAKGKEYLGRVINAAHRMNKLIDDLLTLSRLDRNNIKYRKIDLNKIIENIEQDLSSLIESKNAKVYTENLPKIMTQKRWITEVFRNLINNGLKYNENEKPLIKIGYIEKDNEYEFFIKDNGIGIEEAFNTKIFDLFYRLHTRDKYEGSGAGLTIVKSIIENLKGKLWIDESVLGKGTVFKFTISK